MDLFSPSTSSTRSNFRVPYFSRVPPFDLIEDFQNFPNLHGLSISSTGRLRLDGRLSAIKVASVIQAWLFFGLIHAIAGSSFNIKDFIIVDPSQGSRPFITLQQLCKIPRRRFSARWWKKWSHCYYRAENIVKQIDQSAIGQQTPLLEINISVQLLLAFISYGRGEHFKLHYKPKAYRLDDIQGTSFRKYFRTQTLTRIWCPFQLRCWSLHSPTLVHYLLDLDRSNFPDFISHESCSENSCIANDVDIENYHVQHTTDGCTCASVVTPLDEVVDIVTRGMLPLISLDTRDPHRAEIKVVSAKASTEYIAISHVWSHGLGNLRMNSIPQCQLQQLAVNMSYMPRTRFSSLIWIDTLCIPIGNEDLRKRCIDRMGYIYAGAKAVLVLDYELQRIQSKTIRDSEVLAHIWCCAWMGRAWTLNEGCLSTVCLFQFQDAVIDLLELVSIKTPSRPDRGPIIKPNITLGRTLGSCVNYGRTSHLAWLCATELQLDRKPTIIRFSGAASRTARSDCSDFVRVWNALVSRSTTKKEDLASIMTNLLGLSSYSILDLEPDLRLLGIIANLKIIPLSLLYNSGPKMSTLQERSNRWVPTEVSNDLLDDESLLDVKERSISIEKRPNTQLSTLCILLTEKSHLASSPLRLYEQDSNQFWDINPLQDDCMPFSPRETHYRTVFLVELDTGGEYLRGCRLQVLKQETRSGFLPPVRGIAVARTYIYTVIYADYDCAILVKRIPRNKLETLEDTIEPVHTRVVRLSGPVRIHIRSDFSQVSRDLSRRPVNFTYPMWIYATLMTLSAGLRMVHDALFVAFPSLFSFSDTENRSQIQLKDRIAKITITLDSNDEIISRTEVRLVFAGCLVLWTSYIWLILYALPRSWYPFKRPRVRKLENFCRAWLFHGAIGALIFNNLWRLRPWWISIVKGSFPKTLLFLHLFSFVVLILSLAIYPLLVRYGRIRWVKSFDAEWSKEKSGKLLWRLFGV